MTGPGTAHTQVYMKGPKTTMSRVQPFYNEKQQLFLETRALGVSLGASISASKGWNAVPKQ